MNDAHGSPHRVIIVGRSPSVLVEAVDILRTKGYTADATNQFDSFLDDYDVADLDVLVFGGMVPPDTKQALRDAITARNPEVTFVQGLFGIAGIIAAQVDALTPPQGADAESAASYDSAARTLRLTLAGPAQVTVEALWATSFTPPEPKSTSATLLDERLDAGSHALPLPDEVPDVASYATVTVGTAVHIVAIGGMPNAVRQMMPTSAEDRRLPEVGVVATQGDDE